MRPALFVCIAVVASGCNSQKAIHVASSLAVAPMALDFHVVAVGQSAQDTVTLSSLTSTPVQIASIGLTGAGASAFALGATPKQVAGQASVAVTFTPSAAQAYSATLQIVSNDPDHPTVTATLTGLGALEDVQVYLQTVDGGIGVANEDGGLCIAFGLDTWGTTQPTWPNVLLENIGGAPAKLTGFSFASDAGVFFFPEPPVVPQIIASNQTRVLPVAFQPPVGATQASFADVVTLTFDDPLAPSVSIALSGEAPMVPPPEVCSGMLSVQEVDGSLNTPASFGAVVPVEPGAVVQLTAFSDDLADAGPNPCTSDPAGSRSNLLFQWSVAQAPEGSAATLTTPTNPRTSFKPDVPGHYEIHLAVTDASGHLGIPTFMGADQIVFDAAPLEDLTVRATWAGFQGVDLDLHFVRPGSAPFDPVGDVCSLNVGTSHAWSTIGDPTADPQFSGDDQGNGGLEEHAWINHPLESCLADGGCRFGLWIHYYQDNRSLSGSASCTLPGCVEGQGCGCPADEACEPNPGGAGACAPEVTPEAEVYFKGQVVPALQAPIPLDSLALASPCFLWHAADVDWQPDGGRIVVVGDGGVESYWGDHTDETKQCAENDGGWTARSPPTYP